MTPEFGGVRFCGGKGWRRVKRPLQRNVSFQATKGIVNAD
jgi:hypothetical protein